jgi:biopolymer transport protein ExbD
MDFKRGRIREEPEINLIPLIDLLIVIMIFLFVTTTFSPQSQLQITLPQAGGEKTPQAPQILNIAVDAAGRYAINGQTTPFNDAAGFSQALRAAGKDMKDPIVAISADAAATHQAVVNVMEAARIAGYAQVAFTTQTRAQ